MLLPLYHLLGELEDTESFIGNSKHSDGSSPKQHHGLNSHPLLSILQKNTQPLLRIAVGIELPDGTKVSLDNARNRKYKGR